VPTLGSLPSKEISFLLISASGIQYSLLSVGSVCDHFQLDPSMVNVIVLDG
jgi:hypothetical protein